MSDRERVDAYKQVLSKVFGRRLVPRDLIRFVERDLAIGLCLRDDSDDRVVQIVTFKRAEVRHMGEPFRKPRSAGRRRRTLQRDVAEDEPWQ